MKKRRTAKGRTADNKSAPSTGKAQSQKHWLRPSRLLLLLLAVGALGWAIYLNISPETPIARDLPSLPEASYVGAQHCGSCHQAALDDWTGSHHDLAMQEASPQSVLGDFNNASFSADGVTSLFSTQDGAFFVRTDNARGSLDKYRVRYTFGAFPLQQYLLELPGGRLQVLGIAWDARPKAKGGQRWYKLYEGRNVDHNHPLHWTQPSQNWNFMCAECHSTHLEKNYNADTRAYDTTWSDIDVSCEACHGPASNHLLWTDERYRFGDNLGLTHRFTERQGVHWAPDKQGNPRRSIEKITDTEIGVCAACHSRRSQLFEDDRIGQPLMDSFLPATLDEGLYHADGQVDDEVFVYGSFLQSRMYQAGVTCSDCHNPHSLTLKADGNAVCTQCHAGDYDTETHHFHPPGSAGSQCIDCHMPEKTFMGVDARRDHSFRIPRPDLSAELGVPNTCNSCHTDQNANWSAGWIETWYGRLPEGHQKFSRALAGSRSGGADIPALVALLGNTSQPAIARATAAKQLGAHLNDDVISALASALHDRNAQVRHAATESLRPLPPASRWQLLSPLLSDSSRVVRSTAGEVLADIPVTEVASSEQRAFMNALAEFEQAQRHNADTPGAQVKLGNFLLAQGYANRAEKAYLEAITLDPRWSNAYANLADLYRGQGRDQEGEKLLARGLALQPEQPELNFSMGLLKVRQQQQQAALKHLKQAAESAPMNSRYQYVYAVALDSWGERTEAIGWVRQALKQQPTPELEQLLQQLEATAPQP